MNKFVFLVAMLLTVLLSACGNEEPIVDTIADNAQEVVSAPTDNDQLIQQLTALNDSLIALRPQSRGIFSFFKKVFKIAFADIKGAFTGYKYGSAFGSGFAWVSATIYGVGASASAGNEAFSRAQSFVLQKDVEAAYVLTVNSPTYEADKICMDTRVCICLPKEYASSIDVGKVHNMTLDVLQCNDILSVNVDEYFTAEECQIIHSADYQNYYVEYMGNSDAYDLDSAISSESSNKEDRIIQLFLDLYTNYPEDMDDVNYIINEYINMIEADVTITQEEKEVVYMALAVAGYSTDYWDTRLSQED